jgi:hypothetical protein
MVKLPFLPSYFPVLLLPLYWLFFIAFYVGYLPVYLILVLFSPFKDTKSVLALYQSKSSKAKREFCYSDESSHDDGSHQEGNP